MNKAFLIVHGIIAVAAGILLAGCAAPPFSIAKVEFQGCTWNQSHNQACIVSQDGGQSFAVPGGTLWTFGDSFLGKRDKQGVPHFKGGGIFCSIAFLAEKDKSFPPALQYKTGPGGVAVSPLSLLPGEKEGINMIWPLGGIYANGRYYLYYDLIEKTGNGAWDFRGTGSGLAAGREPLGNYERLRPESNWRFPVAPSQIIRQGSWLYLYEIIDRDGRKGAALARVGLEELENPNSYEYYNQPTNRFSKDKAAQSILVPAAGQVSVAFNPYCNGWLLATSSDFFHPRRISFYFSPVPEGPWKSIGHIQAPEKCQGKRVELVYCTFMHPELFRENGKVVNITFSVHLENGGFDANCEMAEITLRNNRINSNDPE